MAPRPYDSLVARNASVRWKGGVKSISIVLLLGKGWVLFIGSYAPFHVSDSEDHWSSLVCVRFLLLCFETLTYFPRRATYT